MKPQTLRRVFVTLVAVLGLGGLALLGSGAASAEDASAGTGTDTAAAASTSESSSSAATDTKKSDDTKSDDSSDSSSTKESSSTAAESVSNPTTADADVSGPAEWEMDGTAALDDPNLLPGDAVPEADPGTGVVPRYKIDETPEGFADRLRLEIDDSPKVVTPGEWLDWWITVTNIGDNAATGITVDDYVPTNIRRTTMSIEFWDSSQATQTEDDWACGYDGTLDSVYCDQTGDALDPGEWVRFLASGQVKWSADPGDVVANVVEVDWAQNPEDEPLSVVEITPIVARNVANILPVTGSDSALSLLFAGMGLLGAGGLGLGFASRKRS